MYKKEGEEVNIECHAATGKWQVKTGANGGSGICYMGGVDKCEEAGVEEMRGGWEAYNGTSKAWEKQAGALVLAFVVCRVVGCCQETWNSKKGEECCRTCKSLLLP